MQHTENTLRDLPETAVAYIEYLEQTLPKLCTPHDLIAVGLFGNRLEVTESRRRKGASPDYIRLGPKTFRYTKEAVIAWVRDVAKKATETGGKYKRKLKTEIPCLRAQKCR